MVAAVRLEVRRHCGCDGGGSDCSFVVGEGGRGGGGGRDLGDQ